ncbi:hypothetical protein Nepgr_028379 [Nepenthes gracilis]|uniref:Uncharacterized protein n=1 Tax=Nepenthes gracilis TaxID=150966 RepID=A0AAD3Y4G9_NEPGR|nr:hypothetical protein Nepgr_028379 [Nepenthes gracilis]
MSVGVGVEDLVGAKIDREECCSEASVLRPPRLQGAPRLRLTTLFYLTAMEGVSCGGGDCSCVVGRVGTSG